MSREAEVYLKGSTAESASDQNTHMHRLLLVVVLFVAAVAAGF